MMRCSVDKKPRAVCEVIQKQIRSGICHPFQLGATGMENNQPELQRVNEPPYTEGRIVRRKVGIRISASGVSLKQVTSQSPNCKVEEQA